jgi:hypothetical protein
MQQVIIIDTSILCVYLEVPGNEIVGKDDDKWDKQRVDQYLDERIKHKAQFIVPVAAIIETGNHIAQANHQRFVTANRFANLLIQMANREMPWEIFTEQEYQLIWSETQIKQLATEWPKLAEARLSLADFTIKEIANFYHNLNPKKFTVEIFTADQGLKSYEPTVISTPKYPQPRRRK